MTPLIEPQNMEIEFMTTAVPQDECGRNFTACGSHSADQLELLLMEDPAVFRPDFLYTKVLCGQQLGHGSQIAELNQGIQVLMWACLLLQQGINAPAAIDPYPHPMLLQ